MAGKPQKATSALQFTRGGRLERRGPELRAVTDEPRDVPPCPPGLHKSARAIWRAFWRSPAGAVTNMEAYIPTLHHWIGCVSERAHLKEAIAKEPMVKGSMEQDVVNPLVSYLKEIERKIEKYEADFGMVPIAALRLNITEVQLAAGVHDLTRKLDNPRPRTDVIEAEIIDLGELG